ncbi:hypothetical protein FKM82_030190, partial [Ascaphus truei]
FCDLQDDIGQTLSGVTTNEPDLDSVELERELNDILQREEAEAHIDLPDVPTGPIIPSLPRLSDGGEIATPGHLAPLLTFM